MNWQDEMLRQQALTDGIERNLFPDLSPEEQKVANLLQETNDLPLNMLSVKTGFPIGQLVRPLAGGMYHLLR